MVSQTEAIKWFEEFLALEGDKWQENNENGARRNTLEEQAMTSPSEQYRMLTLFLLAQGIGRASHGVADATGGNAAAIFARELKVRNFDDQLIRFMLDTFNDTCGPYDSQVRGLLPRGIAVMRLLSQAFSNLCSQSYGHGGDSTRTIVVDVINTYLRR